MPDEVHLWGNGIRAMAGLFHASLSKLGIPVAEPAPAQVEILTRTLRTGISGKSFAARLTARGGASPYRWSRSTPFPAWLRLTAGGRLSGTVPSRTGLVAIAVRVTDSTGAFAFRQITLRVRRS